MTRHVPVARPWAAAACPGLDPGGVRARPRRAQYSRHRLRWCSLRRPACAIRPSPPLALIPSFRRSVQLERRDGCRSLAEHLAARTITSHVAVA